MKITDIILNEDKNSFEQFLDRKLEAVQFEKEDGKSALQLVLGEYRKEALQSINLGVIQNKENYSKSSTVKIYQEFLNKNGEFKVLDMFNDMMKDIYLLQPKVNIDFDNNKVYQQFMKEAESRFKYAFKFGEEFERSGALTELMMLANSHFQYFRNVGSEANIKLYKSCFLKFSQELDRVHPNDFSISEKFLKFFIK